MTNLIIYFQHLSLLTNMGLFFFLTVLIWLSGTVLVYLVDAISDKTRIAKAFVGLVVLAVITELPEVVTTMTAAASNHARLALNNMFGGISLQTIILVLADALIINRTLTSFPRKPTPVIEGLFLIIMLAVLLSFYFIKDFIVIVNVGLGSVIMAVLYLSSIFIIKRFSTSETWQPFDMPDSTHDTDPSTHSNYKKISLTPLILYVSMIAIIILILGLIITIVAETIASQSGLGTSFIGVTFLAMVTSLPELSTVVAAVRIKAYSMAISNILGSNLIMIFLLFPADLMYNNGPIINAMDTSAVLALLSGIVITGIYCLGLLFRTKLMILRMGIDSVLVLISYLLSLILFYHFR